ncbi:MAG: GNAT family N-acetyltransferase [Waltera sp.]
MGEKSARGKGIGSEVVQILLRYCFMVLGVYSVHLDVLETNTPAIKCYEKAGFRISGRYRGIVTICGTTMTGYTWISYMRNTGKRLNLKGLHAKSARKLAGTTKKSRKSKNYRV